MDIVIAAKDLPARLFGPRNRLGSKMAMLGIGITRGRMGTVRWLERTGGRLAWQERLTLMAQGVRARAAARRRHAGDMKRQVRELNDLLPPDSAITREAVALCQDASPPFLFNHCLRAYFWARLLDDDRRPFDDEAMYTALLLHDLGLCQGHHVQADQGACFTRAGARAATDMAARHAWSERRAALTANAIALHLNVIVGPRHGKEARMVRAGSGADVAGLGLNVLTTDQIDAVVQRHPRLDFKAQIVPLLRDQAQQHPDCRMAFMMHTLGFERLIRRAPMFTE